MTTGVRNQQSKLYAAEDVIPDADEEAFTIEELQVWVDGIRETRWWYDRYRVIERVEVGRAESSRRSVGWYETAKAAGRIEMIPSHRNIPMATHELSHVVAECYHSSHAHDPWFAREYLNLTYFISGSAAYLRLQKSFDDKGVEYTPDL